jgi:hypothetical protein
MDNPKLINMIVHGLSDHRSRNDILKEVCETSGMEWSEAERFVEQVYEEHRPAIDRRRNAAIVALAIFFILAGLAISGIFLRLTLMGYNFPSYNVPYLGNAAYFFLGFMMIVGGTLGLIKMRVGDQ